MPIVPAAHYTWRRDDRQQRPDRHPRPLCAIGEVTYTGLHGANPHGLQLLLECVVYAHQAGADILAKLPRRGRPQPAGLGRARWMTRTSRW